MSNISDLITQSFNKEPIDFAATFNNLLVARIADKIAAKKEEIAQTMFDSSSQQDFEQTQETE